MDRQTIETYDKMTADYVAMVDMKKPSIQLASFLSRLPSRAVLMDLGCGPGDAAFHMVQAGHSVDPVDASSAMVAAAKERFDLPARVATFDDLDVENAFDGIWASFSLLHAPLADLPRHLAAIRKALKSDGLFYIAMKTGNGEVRDQIGRMYSYISESDLTDLLEKTEFLPLEVWTGKEKGLAGNVDPWVAIQAKAIS